MNLTEKEKAIQKTIMVNIDGVLKPRKVAMKQHNKSTPKVEESSEVRVVGGRPYISAELLINRAKKISAEEGGNMKKGKLSVTPEHKKRARAQLEKEALGEDFDYDVHNDLVKSASKPVEQKKFRLKNKKTGGTVGIFNSHAEALSAHRDHPNKHMLTVESLEMTPQEVIRSIVESKKEFQQSEQGKMLKFSEFNSVNEAIEDILDDLLESSPFDWKKTPSQIDWKNDSSKSTDSTVHKGTYGSEGHKSSQEKVEPVVKKSVGRPKGAYKGEYKKSALHNKDESGHSVAGKNALAGRAASMQREVEGSPELKKQKVTWSDVLASHKALKGKGEAPVTYGAMFAAVAHAQANKK